MSSATRARAPGAGERHTPCPPVGAAWSKASRTHGGSCDEVGGVAVTTTEEHAREPPVVRPDPSPSRSMFFTGHP